jgi:WD40 repeat protein
VFGTLQVTASGSTAIVWSARTARVRFTLEGYTGTIASAAFSPNGRWIVTAGDDQTTRISDASEGRLLAVLRNHASAVAQAAFSPDGNAIVSADAAGDVGEYPCLPCLGLKNLRALAAARVTRTLTNDERVAYLGEITGS